jgi:pyridoxal phosphate enzyme, YggS family
MSNVIDPRTSEIRRNLEKIENAIRAACDRAGRRREDVTLIAVSKTFPAEAINIAVAAGVTDVGENRVQEMREKIDVVVRRPRLHMIGHLQSNKAKEAVRLFDVIHTIDSMSLAAKVAAEAEHQAKRITVLIQMNVGEEAQKSGVETNEALALTRELAAIPALDVRGFMAIPPVAPPDETRHHFRTLRELLSTVRSELAMPQLTELSMGMSEDYEIAIEEGATMIRLGRAVFGSRA